MISCIVVELHNSLWEKINHLLNILFKDDQIEFDIQENDKLYIYVYDVEKIKVWQMVLNIECEQIPVGFGFEKEKQEARRQALERLKLISKMNIH